MGRFVGIADGRKVGANVGDDEGSGDGDEVGSGRGTTLGTKVAWRFVHGGCSSDGGSVGKGVPLVGSGVVVGSSVGDNVGTEDGVSEGSGVGTLDGNGVGDGDGTCVGLEVGGAVGTLVGNVHNELSNSIDVSRLTTSRDPLCTTKRTLSI